jgi:RHS repeat-associated protein
MMQAYSSTTSLHVCASRSSGKERDAESGNDYFGARYYASTIGRWLSPDWSAKEEPVPYAKLDNPQTLNLYSYVGSNPLSNADTDGHACISLVNANTGFCTRADTYKMFDDRVYSKTRFFAAASAAASAQAPQTGSAPAVPSPVN